MTGSSLDRLAAVTGAELIGSGSTKVMDVTHDSRRVGPGSLFIAVRGSESDGHRFVGDAMAAGASALCVERRMDVALPQLVLPDTRSAMAVLAVEVHGDPSRRLKVVGVTGTNGKTTVTHYLESMAVGAGMLAGLMGTVQTRAAGQVFDQERTTPEAPDFQRLLAAMADLGCQVVAAEISSHALELGRVKGTRFEVAAFTNLSQDHLDFHGNMDAYLAAKTRLFREYEVATSVINIDDPAGQGIASAVDGDLVTVGAGGDAFAEEVRPTPAGTSFRMVTPWGSADVEARLRGMFNVENAMLASVSALSVGLTFEQVVSGLVDLPVVPGRFQTISGDDPVTVIVDYAHTPDGVRMSVATARSLGAKRLIALVGAGGDRDRDKRPMMGSAVSGADVAVITSDNPRSEDPEAIIAAVVEGVSDGTELVVEVDRRLAIRTAIGMAMDGDVVLILGRGHEPFQEVGGRFLPFDDREVGQAELRALRSSTNSGPEVGSMGA
jgi:UDP-N-acetylmuramoyl-L-alanyl-D-glutamate--2,6-diaminopimelate ligase